MDFKIRKNTNNIKILKELFNAPILKFLISTMNNKTITLNTKLGIAVENGSESNKIENNNSNLFLIKFSIYSFLK